MISWYTQNPEKGRSACKRYRDRHPERFRESQRKYREAVKERVMDHYGRKCSWPGCEVDDPDMLQIDHINGGGNQHYKKLGGGGYKFYGWLSARNFPPGYRILCANHNWKHRANMARANKEN